MKRGNTKGYQGEGEIPKPETIEAKGGQRECRN